MAEKTTYSFRVDPQWVDYSMRASVASLTNAVLGVAGVDAQQKGFGTDVLIRQGVSWVLLRMAVEYDSRPEQYTDLKITTWVSDYSRMMSTRNFTLEDEQGQCIGRVVTQWCMIDLTTRRPVDMTQVAVAEVYNRFLVEAPSPCTPPQRLGSIEPVQRYEREVVYSDIDFNRHVNTMRYIDLMLDRLPIELVGENRPLRLDLNFHRECRYGQQLQVGYQPEGERHLFEIQADGTPAVRGALTFK